MKRIFLSKKILSTIVMTAVIAIISTMNAHAYEINDGAYIIGRTTSYTDPDTGQTVDGGTNIALGDSMAASIIEEEILVEQSQGSTYMTIGIGLMSNIEDVRIQVQTDDGSYYDVPLTLTGSCERNGDVCNHYRFEVDSASRNISPIIYVTPMGRDVQFFVVPDTGNFSESTGNFLSEMVEKPAEEETVYTETSEETQPTEAETTTAEVTETVLTTETTAAEETVPETESTTEQITTVSAETMSNENSDNSMAAVAGIIGGVVVVGGIVGYIVYKKKRSS